MNKDFIQLTATPRLMELLSSINHLIAYQIIEQIKYRQSTPISFLDFGDTNDTVSFVHASKVWELMSEHGDRYKEQGWKTKRSIIKVGKMIKLLYGNIYPINQPKGMNMPKPPVDIETFVNMFKAEKDKEKNYDRFELVNGKDIKYWYNQANYSRFIQEDTTLAKSCLRYEESGKFLEMYVNNPQIVNMLILKDDINRLRGRALVWNLMEPEGRIYMERIYSINDYDVELYKNYARERGWLYKSRQTFGYNHNIIDGKNGVEYCWENFVMRAQTKVKPHRYYPYLDTLCVYNTVTGMLSNEGKLLRRPPHIKLSDYQGGFHDEADHREQVFSNHYNDYIPREEAQFVDLDNDWIFSHEVVCVHNSGGKHSFSRSPLVCCSNILGKTKYFLKSECVYSDYLRTWIYKDSVKEAYLDKNDEKPILIHRRMINKYFVQEKGILVKKKVNTSSKLDSIEEKYRRMLKPSRTSSSYEDFMRDEWGRVNDRHSERENWDVPIDENDTEEPTPRNNNVMDMPSMGERQIIVSPRRRATVNRPDDITDDFISSLLSDRQAERQVERHPVDPQPVRQVDPQPARPDNPQVDRQSYGFNTYVPPGFYNTNRFFVSVESPTSGIVSTINTNSSIVSNASTVANAADEVVSVENPTVEEPLVVNSIEGDQVNEILDEGIVDESNESTERGETRETTGWVNIRPRYNNSNGISYYSDFDWNYDDLDNNR